MRFTKMQGAGNDFVVIENFDGHVKREEYSRLAEKLCTRRFSIGADGLMVLERSQNGGDIRMTFLNSDGSFGEMCGNGARCVTRYALEHGFGRDGHVTVETTAGMVTGRREASGLFTVRLNDPTVLEPEWEIVINGKHILCAYVELGDPGIPHAVVLWEDWEAVPEEELRKLGRAIRSYPGFPKGANVTFCRLAGENALVARTFERGVEDFTLACGTGCGSTVAALTARGVVSGRNTRLSVPGGDLYVSVNNAGGKISDILLTGPAVTVAVGETPEKN